MTIWDDRILETISNDPDNIGRVKDLSEKENIRISRSSVSRRCSKLADHGLLRRVGDGVYLLTERGQGYLDGEISTYEDEPDEVRDSDTDAINGPNGIEEPGNAG
ncbi:Transcriptional regulator, MarR family [Halapricum desulfuricans]|uniref:Transcriptional regulator, MarR family n=2 Tax=Halapricum desulfuricans TaxID=2841257 RepID=A0A897N1R1_9EURY|nr:Transcriptional regulator, MarR family [Halapricum desulfuricans]